MARLWWALPVWVQSAVLMFVLYAYLSWPLLSMLASFLIQGGLLMAIGFRRVRTFICRDGLAGPAVPAVSAIGWHSRPDTG